MMNNIYCIANQKGGVAKSTSTLNLGAALAVNHNKKVLLIDLDPQSNLSEYLKFEPDEKGTLTNLILEVTSNSVIDSQTVLNTIRYNELNMVYYIPSDINLANAESFMQNTLSRETVLKRILSEEVTSQFDYVFIDCLPSLGILLINAMTASSKMIIPVQTQKFAMDGLQALNVLHSQIRNTINPELKIMGMLPTMVDNTLVSRKVLTTLKETYGELIFESIISKSIEAAKSTESGRALCLSNCKVGSEYAFFAEEFLRKQG